MSTIYEQIEAIVSQINDYDDLKKKIEIVMFRNKENPKDTFLETDYTATELFEKKINFADYEREILIISMKQQIKEKIFGNSKFTVTKEIQTTFSILNDIVEALVVKTRKTNKEEETEEQEKE